MLVSIGRFLQRGGNSSGEETWKRMALLLIDALSVQTFHADPQGRSHFQGVMSRLGEQLSKTEDPAEVLVITGEAISTIGECHRTTERLISSRTTELASIIRLL